MNSTKFRILVVDGDPKTCDLLTKKLNLCGFISLSCTNGEAALKLLSTEGFDAVISALNMPGISGLQLLEATRRLAPHTAFLMATGVGDIGLATQAMKQGADDYLMKPFQLDAVVASVARALGVRRLERELADYRTRLEERVDERTGQLQTAQEHIGQIYDKTLAALGPALDIKGRATAGHGGRVSRYCMEIAKVMGCSQEQMRQLKRGAYLHDIGKIAIPDAILLKRAKLTPEEMTVMSAHPKFGYEFVGRISLFAEAVEIVLTHHERYDGSGYPQGLAGEDIPMGARIVAVANAFDAIRSDFPYRRGRPYSVARAEIQREARKQFDPKVVEVFLSIPEETWEKISAQATRDRSTKGNG
jgi:response regulator RpfG family c-di-GMP phosphodiesterase